VFLIPARGTGRLVSFGSNGGGACGSTITLLVAGEILSYENDSGVPCQKRKTSGRPRWSRRSGDAKPKRQLDLSVGNVGDLAETIENLTDAGSINQVLKILTATVKVIKSSNSPVNRVRDRDAREEPG
jgi:hypothetical protein